ncbi:MAG: aminotransferase class V-fold PLP-dependent enzyme [Flavobacteriaceae bacterium]|nr:aminotransferase class V-fold PLP-dependent enzyme [Bacteroidia bacterium]NNL62103.1 aminotransferase class V-fold PLP-dependent enzyme [Flavobacteriaceae bacterium]
MTLKHQKHLFDLPDDITYLNIAAQSPSFKSVTEAGMEGLKQKSQPHTIKGTDYFEPVTELRKLFAEVIDCDEFERVATSPSVSYGLANIANNITLKNGDEILVIEEQFPSNIYIWQKLADKYDANIVTVKAPESNNNPIKQWNKEILDGITDKTAVVAMGNIHWSNGALFHLMAIRKKSRQHNALLIVDGSQSIGAMPFSVNELQPDAVVCAGYKWLFGPYGCAYAYYGPHFDGGRPIEENWSNRLNSENFAGLTEYQSKYKSLANRYMVGENGNFIYTKMQIAALKQVLKWKPEDIQEYCKAIALDAVEELKKMGCEIEESDQRSHHLFGVRIPEGLDLKQLKAALEEQKVYVSFRGQYIRVSCHYFNTKEDFNALVNCMGSVLETA